MKDNRREISGLLKYNDCMQDFGGSGDGPTEWGAGGVGGEKWGGRGGGLIKGGEVDAGLEDRNFTENIVDVNDEIFVHVARNLFGGGGKGKSILAKGLTGKRFTVLGESMGPQRY